MTKGATEANAVETFKEELDCQQVEVSLCVCIQEMHTEIFIL